MRKIHTLLIVTVVLAGCGSPGEMSFPKSAPQAVPGAPSLGEMGFPMLMPAAVPGAPILGEPFIPHISPIAWIGPISVGGDFWDEPALIEASSGWWQALKR